MINRLINDEVDNLVTLRDHTGKYLRIVSLNINEELFEKIKKSIIFLKQNPDFQLIRFKTQSKININYSMNISDSSDKKVISFLKEKNTELITLDFDSLNQDLKEIVEEITGSQRDTTGEGVNMFNKEKMITMSSGGSYFDLTSFIKKYKIGSESEAK